MRARVAAAGISLALAWLVSPHVYGQFSAARGKVVRSAVPVTVGALRVPIPSDPIFESLRPPFAAISRIRNDSASTLLVSIALDDVEVCRAEIAPGASRRIDCRVSLFTRSTASHTVVFAGSTTPYTVEYFELATHYGALSPGPRSLIVAPLGISGFRPASPGHLLLVWFLAAMAIASVRHHALPKWLSTIHLVTISIVGLLVAVVIGAEWISPYSLLIQDTFLERLLGLVALPAAVSAAIAFLKWTRRPKVRPFAIVVTTGLVVGGVYFAYAADRVHQRYRDNVSGLVLISHNYFDRDPIVNGREDIRRSLIFDPGGGADGQFFYLMTFDPLLSVFRNEPQRYADFIDAPPYRYGRIGFSLLTRFLSFGRPLQYPATMVALVICSLMLSGALLGRIAQHHGQSGWLGLLIVLVPGFWQSVESTMPEPLAIAFVLGAYLCMVRRTWWASGALLGAAMLVRETSGVLVLALVAAVALSGRRREAGLIAALAFLPILMWKAFLGWVLWPAYGANSLFHAPNDIGPPLAGVAEMLRRMRAGVYLNGNPDALRAGISCAVLTTAAAALAFASGIARRTPFTVAAGLYAVLTISYNYDGVWLHMSQAQRLTIDLFVVLALAFLQSSSKTLRLAFVLFWLAAAWHVFFGTLDAADARASLLRWWM